MSDVNWEQWALDMCDLLDRIEAVADDGEAVYQICRGRFEIARQHGFTVEFGGPTSGELQ